MLYITKIVIVKVVQVKWHADMPFFMQQFF